MKVTQVALIPTEQSKAAGRPSLTPELLAASGARYSRNNFGLDAILAKIDPQNLDKSVDSIFQMLDYGHQSIADMAPVAMFMDGVSMWLAYHIWSVCPLAGGQESSTRYLKLSADNLPDADALGIASGPDRDKWERLTRGALVAYEKALLFWENEGKQNPNATKIPRELLEDSGEKAQRTVARMRRNYAFDRARYFLPSALQTNVMMVQSARAWTSLCQNLLSHPLPEAQKLGALVRDELALAAPRLLKHAVAKPSFQNGQISILKRWQIEAKTLSAPLSEANPTARVEVFAPENADFARDLAYHDNRYAFFGPDLGRAAVRFGWEAVAFADIRDLNRHRTGNKWCPLVPQGFYSAIDQTQNPTALKFLQEIGREASHHARELLQNGDWTFVYHTLLGTQFPFEHLTTANHFLYEAELRTGTGAHYRYAKHLHDALEKWYEIAPDTRDLVLEGEAEPE